MIYDIEPYIWIKRTETTFIQTRNNTVAITSNALANYLIDIEKRGIQVIDDKDINSNFKDSADQITDFLKQNGLIHEHVDLKYSIELNTIFYTNDASFAQHIESTKEYKVFYNANIESTSLPLDNNELDSNNLLVIYFLNPFSQRILETITKRIREKKIMSQVIFTYNNKIYFSNIYKSDWYNPCPLCFYSELEAQLRNDMNEYKISFQTLVDIFYDKHGDFISTVPLRIVDYFNIISLIIKRITNKPLQINTVSELNLRDYSTVSDTAYHWGYCDCYE